MCPYWSKIHLLHLTVVLEAHRTQGSLWVLLELTGTSTSVPMGIQGSQCEGHGWRAPPALWVAPSTREGLYDKAIPFRSSHKGYRGKKNVSGGVVSPAVVKLMKASSQVWCEPSLPAWGEPGFIPAVTSCPLFLTYTSSTPGTENWQLAGAELWVMRFARASLLLWA